MEKFKSIGGCLLLLAFAFAGLVVIVLLIRGAGWMSDRLLPWFSGASVLAFAVLVLLLIPLSAISKARPYAAVAMLIVSYVFGITVWMEGLLLTLSTWGIYPVIVGLLFMGVGVVPIAILSALVHGMWSNLAELVIMILLTYGTRYLSFWVAEKE